MSPARDAARGRARAYALLAEVLARGVDGATRDAVSLSPAIAAALATYDDPDGPAVDHHQVFGETVFPIEGAFLDPDGQVGGEQARRLGALYATCGFAPDPRTEPPEHLATELRALAFLSAAEADALRDRQQAAVAAITGHARALLDQHLLRWLPALAVAARRSARPWPTALIDQIEDLALLHLQSIDARQEPAATPPPPAGEGQGRGAPSPSRPTFELPPLPDLLADEGTSLRRVAALLATPSRTGVYLGRADLAKLGRSLGLPRGFGSRTDLLENLLLAAGRYDAIEPLLGALAALVTGTRDALAQARYDDPAVRTLTAPWRARCDETLVLLDGLGAAVRALSGDPG